jgi:hypothetical protein
MAISIAIDDERITDIPCYWQPTSDGYGGQWVVGTPEYPDFDWETTNPDGGSVELEGMFDPDPSLGFGIAVIDAGAPSNFSFSFVMPLAPLVNNPSFVFDSLSGSVVNGAAAGNVTVTALAPPVGIPVDGDGVTELQVYTLSDDGGVTWKNVGLDAGLTTVIPLGSFNAGPYGAYNQGPIPTIAGGPWTHMRADLNFRLSGGNDSLTLTGSKDLVPEPSTALVALLTLAGFAYSRRR